MAAIEKLNDGAPGRSVIDLVRAGLVAVFIAACCAPMIAISLSPKLTIDMVGRLSNANTRAAALETLRHATPLWENGVAIYNTALYHIATSGKPNVGMMGRHGWVFLGDVQDKSFSQTIRRRVLSDQETDHWTMTLNAQARWLAARGIPMLFVVAPSQGSVYPEELPGWSQKLLGNAGSFDRVLASPRKLPIIDLRGPLRDAKATGATYSRMNSHWTDFGAWVAWQNVARDLQARLPGFVPFGVGGLARIETLPDASNEFRNMLGITAPNPWDRYVLDRPFPDYQIVAADGTITTVPGTTPTGLLDLPRQTYNPQATSNLTALILRDSMGDAISPFFQSSFKRTFQLNHHRTQYPKDQINLIPSVEAIKPDVVVYIMTERYFNVPLGNAFYWLSVDRYGVIPSDHDLVWTPASSVDAPLQVDMAKRGARSGAVNWQRDPTVASEQVLRMELTSSDYGFVRTDYKSGGKLVQIYEEIYKGKNDLYVALPGAVDDDKVDFTVGGDVGIDIVRISLRRAR